MGDKLSIQLLHRAAHVIHPKTRTSNAFFAKLKFYINLRRRPKTFFRYLHFILKYIFSLVSVSNKISIFHFCVW